MARFVALLRGVNVGRGNRLPMADWRALMEGLGWTGVSTLLNSGNAVFTAEPAATDVLAASLKQALSQRMDLDVPVFVRTATAWQQAIADVEQHPLLATLDESEHSKLLLTFTEPNAAFGSLSDLADRVTGPEAFWLGREVACLYCPHGISKSVAAEALLSRKQPLLTTRNLRTARKLQHVLDDRLR